jgi:hypothetical protein
LFPFALVLGLCAAGLAFTDEQKEEKKKEPPRVIVIIPLGVVPGVTNTIKIRGLNLTNATAVRFPEIKTPVAAKIKTSGKAEVPKEQDAKKAGDTQLEVELKLPPETAVGSQPLVIVSPDGESQPQSLLVLDKSLLVEEQEPNNGFRQAQEIQLPATVQGSIQSANDVDVFRFAGKAGQKILFEVVAARYGSSLDAILTLYDERGHILATNDDTDAGADAKLQVKLPGDGTYFISLIDAHDKGGPTHVYQLVVSAEK